MYPVFEIEWIGPYTSPQETDKANILYLVTGSQLKGRHINKIRYIGKTTNTTEGRFNTKHKFWKVFGDDRQFWIGSIKGSNSAKKAESAISKAEWLLVHFLSNYSDSNKIELMNERLLNEPNYKSFGVVNRWYNKRTKKEYEKYMYPFKNISDIILWDKSRGHIISAPKIYVERDDESE